MQNCITRFIYSNYSPLTSVPSLKKRSHLASLSSCRRTARLSPFYRFIFNSTKTAPYITRCPCTPYRSGHLQNTFVQTVKTVTFFKSFCLLSASKWNGLPYSITTLQMLPCLGSTREILFRVLMILAVFRHTLGNNSQN